MSLTALVVDDERLARKRLRQLLARHPGITVVAEADDMESAVAAAETWKPDVLFLDVELASGNGLDLPSRLTVAPKVVFVTAYESFAVQAFAVTAFDYLLKPVHPERLARTVRRLLENAPPPPPGPVLPAAADTALTMQDRVSLKDRGAIKIVAVDQIAAIKAVGAYSRVLLRDLAPMVVLRGISDWERVLPAGFFIRLDRSLILQLPLVRAIEPVSRNETSLRLAGLAASLAIGRVAAQRLKSCAPALFGAEG